MEESSSNEGYVTPELEDEDYSASDSEDVSLEDIRKSFCLSLDLMSSPLNDTPVLVLDQLNLDGIANYIKSEKCKNIVTLAGAGISTSAGIPDFRSPGSGLYDNLQKYNLPYPQAIFEMSYFMENPKPFFFLAKELYPGSFKPTVGHYFIKLLEEKGLLLRHYTQNIDTLERVAGMDPDKLIEAHGSFHTSHCVNCRTLYDLDWMKEKIFSDVIPSCEKCKQLVKPDIVFFGENLPYEFFEKSLIDLPLCDLLIIMGSSLVVQPFASLKDRVRNDCPRLLINKEKVGEGGLIAKLLGIENPLDFDASTNMRDVFFEGTCDDGCLLLAEKLGWGDELKELVRKEHEIIDHQKIPVANGPTESKDLLCSSTKFESSLPDENKSECIMEDPMSDIKSFTDNKPN